MERRLLSGDEAVVSADDPGMSSSQNEQDNRHYAVAASLPMLEPSDSQEAYDLALAALELSERWKLPVILRMTTRVCHGKSIVARRPPVAPRTPAFERDIPGRVMIPAYARPAHRRLRKKLEEILAWAEAAPGASFLELKTLHPLPVERIRAFAASVEKSLPNRKSLNVALLGALSRHLDLPEALWLEAVKAALPERLHQVNEKAFRIGRETRRP